MQIKPVMIVAMALLGCAREPASSGEPPGAPAAVLVNGRAISEAEVRLRMRERGRAVSRDEALEALVLLELQAQRAEAAGAANDPAFLAEMEPVLAKMRDARRLKLARSWRLRTLAKLEPPTEADARAWLASHADFVQAQWHLKRITTRSRAEADQALAGLEAGRPFDEVAASFPGEPVEVRELGFDSIPESWWTALAPLAAGAHTQVIPGGERFVILQLVERKALPPADFATLRRRIDTILQARAFEEQLRSMATELRKGAAIEVKSAPVSAPAPSPELPEE